jgi:3-deoxy-D-manno-octulosonic-acid transferase
MTRLIYNTLLWLATPLMAAKLAWRALKNPLYRHKMAERIGIFDSPPMPHCIWIHAVSLGEAIAAAPLITRLQQHNPNDLILITTMTPTGYAWIKKHFKHTITHAYLPYDFPPLVKRFFKYFNPKIGIVMETELWPNLLHIAKQQKIPMLLANARLSPQSLRHYQRIPLLAQTMLKQIDHVLAQSPTIAQRFQQLGLTQTKTTITGNLKFHHNTPDAYQKNHHTLNQCIQNNPCWIAASTHPGEEATILKSHQQILQQHPNCKLILAPRHPERCHNVTQLITKHQLSYDTFTNKPKTLTSQILLIDTIGELMPCFAIAQAAFIGGSLIPKGGHNLIEPLLFHLPMATGPHTFNFADVHELLQSHQLCTTITDTLSLTEFMLTHLKPPCNQHQQRCQQLIDTQQGALEKHLAIIQPLLKTSHQTSLTEA